MVENLKILFKDRLETDQVLKDYIKDAREVQALRNRSSISLNYEKRKKEIDELEKKRKNRNNNEGDLSQSIDQSEIQGESSAGYTLEKDLFLKEGLYLLAELSKDKVEH